MNMTDQVPNTKPCVICGVEMSGPYSMHNAEPVEVGQGCDSCNAAVVVPARLGQITRRREVMEK